MKKLLLILVLSIVVYANCDSIIKFNSDGTPVSNEQVVTVMDYNVSLYDKYGNGVKPNGKSVPFNYKLYIAGYYDNARYYLVKKKPNGSPIGYIEKSKVFCGGRPLKAESGLLKKFYIKTAIHDRKNKKLSFVTAYHSPTGSKCENNDCPTLKRFNSYYIFKETKNRYLLANTDNFTDQSSLTGWVDKKDGYIWKTGIAIRPSENLSDDNHIYFYKTLEDAKANRNGNPILGGMRWFNIPMRIPVLKTIKDGNDLYYEVVLSTGGIGVKKVGNKLMYVDDNVSSINIRDKFNKVDIMFLVDGTKSMQPYIDKIIKKGGIIDKLLNEFRKDVNYKGLTIRASYRIYRDSYAGERNLGEGVALNGACNEDFSPDIANVRATNESNDDFKENLYGGINKAIQDMRSCRDNLKMIFVIGDAGNRDNPKEFNKIVKQLKANNRHKKDIRVVFIQTPFNESLRDNLNYEEAYKSFEEQAMAFAKMQSQKELESKHHKNDSQTIKFYFKTDDKNLVRNILNSQVIKGFLNQKLKREVERNIADGHSLVETIDIIQKRDEFRSIPALVIDEIIDGSCKELGAELCEGKVYNVVTKGYIKATKDIKEDVFFTTGQFDKLDEMMTLIKWSSSLRKKDQRRKLVELLKDALPKVTGQHIFSEYEDEQIDTFLKRFGLPTRDDSPLFKYTINSLQNKDGNGATDQEIRALYNWIESSKAIFKLVRRNKIPILKLSENQTFKNIPIYEEIDEKDFPVGYKGYFYNDKIQNIRFSWIPKNYLP